MRKRQGNLHPSGLIFEKGEVTGVKYFLDISLALLIVVTIVHCWYKGMIRSIVGAVKVVLAIILTYCFSPKLSVWLGDVYFNGKITAFVGEKLLSFYETGAEKFNLGMIFENLPDWLTTLLRNFDVDVAALSEKYSSATEATTMELQALAASIASPIAKILSDTVAYLAVFLVSLLALTLLAWGLGLIAKLPIIRNVDRVLGLILGVFCAMFYASVYVVLVYTILNYLETTSVGLSFREHFEQTMIFRRAYDWNLFRLLFGL